MAEVALVRVPVVESDGDAARAGFDQPPRRERLGPVVHLVFAVREVVKEVPTVAVAGGFAFGPQVESVA